MMQEVFATWEEEDENLFRSAPTLTRDAVSSSLVPRAQDKSPMSIRPCTVAARARPKTFAQCGAAVPANVR
jgi:hypothetical protein